MSKSALLAMQPSRGLVDRLLAFIDHAAEMAALRDEVVYFGL